MTKNVWLSIAAACLVLQLTGCATGAKAPGMTVLAQESALVSNEALTGRIAVGEVSGGKNTNPLWKSNISTDEFRIALESSLMSFGYSGDAGAYVLSAELLEVDQPTFGLNLSVTSNVNYQLMETSTGQVVFDDTVTASYTAGFGDSALAVKRLRLANEGSIKANIEQLITRLGQLEL